MSNGAKNIRSLIFLSLALSTTGLLLTIALVSRSDYFTSSEPTKKPTHQSTNRIHSPKNFTAAAELMEKLPTIHPPSDIKSQTADFSAFDPTNSSNSSNNSSNAVNKTNATTATVSHPPSDIKSQTADFSAFDPTNSSNSSNNSSNAVNKTNATTATVSNPPSDIKSQTADFSAFDPTNSSNSSNNSSNAVNKTNATTATVSNPPSDIKTGDPAQLPFGFSGSSRNLEESANLPSGADNATAGTVASHTAESLIGSIMSPKTLLSTAMSEIGNSTVKSSSSKPDQIRLVSPHIATILLSNEVIPPKDYLYVYNSLVNKNITGQLLARLPCHSDMKSELLILVGNLSKLKPINNDAKPIAKMSKPGFDCLYGLGISPHIILSQNSIGINNIFNIALYNPSKNPIRLSPGTSVTVTLF